MPLLIFCIALSFALGYGIPAAWRAIRGSYRQRRERFLAGAGLTREAVAAGHGAKAAAAGVKLGAAAATTASGWRVGWSAFRHGFREGWPKGAPKVQEWRERYGGEAPTPVPARPNGCQWSVGGKPCGRHRNGEYCGRHTRAWLRGERGEARPEPTAEPGAPTDAPPPGRRPVSAATTTPTVTARIPAPTAAPAATPAPATPTGRGASRMAIETATGGEVLTRGQFDQEMQAIMAEAQSEMEDANGDLKRAEEDVQRVDLLMASLEAAEVDVATRRCVVQLHNTNGARVAAAKQRIAAADQRHSAADAAVKTLNAARQTTFHTG